MMVQVRSRSPVSGSAHGSLVEKAAVKAGYRCLQHNELYCTICG